MEVLWRLERATVAEVTEALPPPPIAYNSVLTTLRILEQKGHVTHDEAGRAFVYRTTLAREDAATNALKNVVEKFFGNSTASLALRLIESERPSTDELNRLRSLIERYEEK
jgi:predicted transcriptional regulator